MKRRVTPRHFHDEVDRAPGLRPELQSRARSDKFNPLHCIENWRVMGFGKTELLVFDRHAVFQHLHELASLRVQAAITEVDDWRIWLFVYRAVTCARARGIGVIAVFTITLDIVIVV